jgi:hypothetical protein
MTKFPKNCYKKSGRSKVKFENLRRCLLMEQQVMEREAFEVEETNEFEQVFTETTEAAEATVVSPNVRNSNRDDLVKGFIAGLATGLVIGAAAWFHERSKRKALLKQLELSTAIAAAIGKGQDVAVYNKKEIDTAEYVINNPSSYVKVIMDNIDSVKFMTKRERDHWKELMKNITALTVAWYKTGLAEDTIGNEKEIPATEATEILNETK